MSSKHTLIDGIQITLPPYTIDLLSGGTEDQLQQEPVTTLLSEWREGSDQAFEQVTALVYDELRRTAAMCLRGNSFGATLQPTALVHEWYLRSRDPSSYRLAQSQPIIATAARVMRNVLVDADRRRKAIKRGGGRVESLGDLDLPAPGNGVDILAMDQALDKLTEQFPRHAQVVELIFFGGLNASEAALVLSASGSSVSQRTVERDWRFARCWLQNEIERS